MRLSLSGCRGSHPGTTGRRRPQAQAGSLMSQPGSAAGRCSECERDYEYDFKPAEDMMKHNLVNLF